MSSIRFGFDSFRSNHRYRHLSSSINTQPPKNTPSTTAKNIRQSIKAQVQENNIRTDTNEKSFSNLEEIRRITQEMNSLFADPNIAQTSGLISDIIQQLSDMGHTTAAKESTEQERVALLNRILSSLATHQSSIQQAAQTSSASTPSAPTDPNTIAFIDQVFTYLSSRHDTKNDAASVDQLHELSDASKLIARQFIVDHYNTESAKIQSNYSIAVHQATRDYSNNPEEYSTALASLANTRDEELRTVKATTNQTLYQLNDGGKYQTVESFEKAKTDALTEYQQTINEIVTTYREGIASAYQQYRESLENNHVSSSEAFSTYFTTIISLISNYSTQSQSASNQYQSSLQAVTTDFRNGNGAKEAEIVIDPVLSSLAHDLGYIQDAINHASPTESTIKQLFFRLKNLQSHLLTIEQKYQNQEEIKNLSSSINASIEELDPYISKVIYNKDTFDSINALYQELNKNKENLDVLGDSRQRTKIFSENFVNQSVLEKGHEQIYKNQEEGNIFLANIVQSAIQTANPTQLANVIAGIIKKSTKSIP